MRAWPFERVLTYAEFTDEDDWDEFDGVLWPHDVVMSERCGRKMKYRSRKLALRAAGRRWRADGVRLRIYRCDGGWFLTRLGAE